MGVRNLGKIGQANFSGSNACGASLFASERGLDLAAERGQR